MKISVTIAFLAVGLGLAGCTFDQAAPYVAAGCAVGQIAAATAQLNAAALNKPAVAQELALAQQLAQTDCAAALQAIAAAKAAASAPAAPAQ